MRYLMKNLVVGAGLMMIGLVTFANTSEAKTKLVKRNISVLQGSTRYVEMDSTAVKKLKIKGKKYAKVKAKDFYVKIKGKKAGKVTITFKIPEVDKKYKIKVTILPKKKTNKTATKKLNKYLKKLPESTKYAFVYFSEVYQANMTKIFKMESLGIGFRQYTEAGKAQYGVQEDYAYYDDSYDQDDYDYEGWTEEAIKTWLEENEYKKVEMQEK